MSKETWGSGVRVCVTCPAQPSLMTTAWLAGSRASSLPAWKVRCEMEGWRAASFGVGERLRGQPVVRGALGFTPISATTCTSPSPLRIRTPVVGLGPPQIQDGFICRFSITSTFTGLRGRSCLFLGPPLDPHSRYKVRKLGF